MGDTATRHRWRRKAPTTMAPEAASRCPAGLRLTDGQCETGWTGMQNGALGNAKRAGREYETARPALPELTIRTWQDGEMNHWGARPGKKVRRLAAPSDAGAKPASRDFGMHWAKGIAPQCGLAPGTRLTWACWWPPGARRQVALAGLPQPCRRPLPCRPAQRARSPCQT